VDFEVGGVSISGCSSESLSGEVATCATTSLAAGVSLITAHYSGDSNYGSSTSSTLNYTISSAPSAPTILLVTPGTDSATVTWSAAPPNGGLPVLGYTVTASPGSETCTLSMQPAPASLACTVPNLSASVTFTVTATSAGGTSPPSAPSARVTPESASVTVSLTSYPLAPQNLGSPITFTAVVSPESASGWIDFELGGSPTHSCPSQDIEDGIATCTTSWSTAGNYSITAYYVGSVSGLGDVSDADPSATETYAISSSTLGAPSSPLVITSLSGPFTAPLVLTYQGGSAGAGTVFYSVANGTASGCTIGTNAEDEPDLSVTDPGTCLVTASQSSAGSYLGDSSNVTTVVMYAEYPATYGIIGSYYDCESGGTQNGNTCTLTSDYAASIVVDYSCPSGWSGPDSSEECYRFEENGDETYTPATGTDVYTCPSGGTDDGALCIVTTTYSATLIDEYGYTCPNGGSLGGSSDTNCFLSSGGSPVDPGSPTSVLADAGNESALVYWIAPSVIGSSSIVSYTVTATDATTPANGGEMCTANMATACTVNGLTNGNSYTFSVIATNVSGSGPSSTSSNAVVPAAPPGAPTGVTSALVPNVANGSSPEAAVTWTAPSSNGGLPVTLYTVTSSPGGETCSTTTASTCDVTGLTPGDSYTFSVTAANAVGTSEASSSSAAVVAATVPSAPAGLIRPAALTPVGTFLTNEAIDLTTISPTLEASGDVLVLWVNQNANLGLTVTGISETSGTGEIGTPTEIMSHVGTATSTYTSIWMIPVASAGSSTLTIAWSGSVEWYGEEYSTQEFEPSTPSTYSVDATGTFDQSTASTTVDFPALTPANANETYVGYANDGYDGAGSGTSGYTFTTTSPGGSEFSNAAAWATGLGTTEQSPAMQIASSREYTTLGALIVATPKTGIVEATSGNGSATVSWATSSSTGGDPITLYTATSSPGDFTCTSSSTSCTVSGLTNGDSYTFSVTATNADGASSPSSSSAAVVPLAASAELSPVGSFLTNEALDLTTISPTLENAGDVLVLWVNQNASLDMDVTGITQTAGTGEIGTPTEIMSHVGTATSTYTSIWIIPVVSAGSATLTIAWSGSVEWYGEEYSTQEFEPSVSSTYSVDTTGTLDQSTASTTIDLPPLSPAMADETYVGYANDGYGGAGSNGTSGYTFETTSPGGSEFSNVVTWGTGLGTTEQSPETKLASAKAYTSLGALIIATPKSGG
jgi:hypothetical protein